MSVTVSFGLKLEQSGSSRSIFESPSLSMPSVQSAIVFSSPEPPPFPPPPPSGGGGGGGSSPPCPPQGSTSEPGMGNSASLRSVYILQSSSSTRLSGSGLVSGSGG